MTTPIVQPPPIQLLLEADRKLPLLQRLRHAYARDNPYYLLNLFNALLLGSFLTVLAVAGTALFWIYSTSMLHNAEITAVSVGKAILSAQMDNLLTENPDGSLRLAIAPENMKQTDTQMQRYLRFFNMYRIVIFDAQRRIIYSTQPEIIGHGETGNANLDTVLAHGKPYSEIVRQAPGDQKGGPPGVALFVESYMPILDARQRALGAFEVYVNISGTQAEIVKVVSLSLGMLALVLAVCLLSLYCPMKRGTLKMISADRELRELATKDHLTGIYNRRYIAARVRQEFHRWRRHATSMQTYHGVSFIMLDIDRFKKINDTYGHAAGDEVLKEVAHRLGEGLREYDMLGRYGGEEFLVMLPNVGAETAVCVAERLRWAIGGHDIKLENGRSVKVTISLGLACAVDSSTPEHEVMHYADLALYQAKAQGRDRVVLYRPPTAGESPAIA